MVTDLQLQQAIALDPFHQAAEQADDAGTVLAMLAQLFPNADTTPAPCWGKPTARARFTRTSLRPQQ